jgi:hypothetical protein
MDSKQQETEAYISSLQEVVQMYESGASTNTATEICTLSKAIASLKIPDRSEPVLPEFTKGSIEKQEIKRQLGSLSQINISKTMQHPNMKLTSSFTKIQEICVPNLSDVYHLSPLPSGEACASDMKGNFVHFDQQGNILNTKLTAVSTGKGCHTVTTEGEILFTHDKHKAIYRVSRNMFITLTTTADWEPEAIYSSHINGDVLVGMNRNRKWKVTRYSKGGKRLQDIQRNDKGRPLYQSICYLTENINGDICVSDPYQVVVVTGSGQYRFSYPAHWLVGFYLNGICTDALGHIIVCYNSHEVFESRLSGNIHLLSEDGQLLKSLDAGQDQSAVRAVCVDDQHNLWVGRESSNVVSVYRYLEK